MQTTESLANEYQRIDECVFYRRTPTGRVYAQGPTKMRRRLRKRLRRRQRNGG